jgi:hypothetical protein
MDTGYLEDVFSDHQSVSSSGRVCDQHPSVSSLPPSAAQSAIEQLLPSQWVVVDPWITTCLRGRTCRNVDETTRILIAMAVSSAGVMVSEAPSQAPL